MNLRFKRFMYKGYRSCCFLLLISHLIFNNAFSCLHAANELFLEEIQYGRDRLIFNPSDAIYRIDGEAHLATGESLTSASNTGLLDWRSIRLEQRIWRENFWTATKMSLHWLTTGYQVLLEVEDALPLRSDLSKGHDLDLRRVNSWLIKPITGPAGVVFKLGYGATYAEFGYDGRQYIFKNGPDPALFLSCQRSFEIQPQWSLQLQHSSAHFWFDGDKFRNKVDSRQGEPRVSSMFTLEHRSGMALQYRIPKLSAWDPKLGLEIYHQYRKVEMSTGWRRNSSEIMRQKDRWGTRLQVGFSSPHPWIDQWTMNLGLDLQAGLFFNCSRSI